MVSQVSPGVIVNEIDFSDFAAFAASSVAAMVGPAQRGPMNTVTLVTNERQLIETFGAPLDSKFGYMIHAAIQFLRNGNQLRVVRIGDGNEAAASASIRDASSVTTFTVSAKTPGTWATGIGITISAASVGTDSFKLTVTYQNREVEIFDNLTKTAADENYLVTRINEVSDYITITDSGNTVKPANLSYTLSGGNNGTGSLAADDYIGTISGNTRTGLKTLQDSEAILINILMAPGACEILADNTKAVETELVSLAEQRADCIAVLDPRFDLSVSEVIDFANGTGTFSGGNAINSSYAALYWPWVQYYDAYNAKTVWTPPSGWAASIYARTDRVTDPWFAPAGLNRGRLTGALNIEYSPTLGEREQLYGPGQCVNPIVNFVPDGITIWGQKTTQRKASSLDRVNVRRLLLFAEKTIATSVRYLLFEPNDPVTWRRFVGLVQPVLQQIKGRRGLEEFRVICDETTNPPELRDRNTMRGLLLLKPTKTAEIIQVDFTLLSSGATFAEFAP
jgi:phage tail sheath protein FI